MASTSTARPATLAAPAAERLLRYDRTAEHTP
jgi:hypothetical protein